MAVKVGESSTAHVVVVTSIVVPVIAFIFVTLRGWARFFITHCLGWDDYTAIVTLLFCIAYSLLIGLSTNHDIVSKDNKVEYVKWTLIADIMYLMSLLGYKMSILLLYLRLFGVNKLFRYSTWLTIFFVFGYLFSNLLTQLFGCSPISKYWNSTLPGHCINYTKAGLCYGSMNIISDFIIFVLPLRMVWKLKLSRKEKISLSLVFMTGAIACAVAIVRYYYIVRNNAADATYFIWSVLEINTGLICSCTPAFKPLLNHVIPKIASYGSGRTHPSVGPEAYNHESVLELRRYRSVGTSQSETAGQVPPAVEAKSRGGGVGMGAKPGEAL